MSAYLELFETTGSASTTRRKIEIFKDVTRLGRERGLEVEITLEAANVSRRHAEIRHQDNSYLLVDLGSFNGTFLNGHRITGAEVLNNNDIIQLGPGGPNIRFRTSVSSSLRPGVTVDAGSVSTSGRFQPQEKHPTIVAGPDTGPFQDKQRTKHVRPNEPQVFLQRPFDRPQLT